MINTKRQLTFHLLGLTHLPVSEKYMGCAFTQKIVKLSRMLIDMGHTVYLYGIEGSDAECSEFINVCPISEIKKEYGVGYDNELGYDWKGGFFKHNFDKPWNSATTLFFANAEKEIRKRMKPSDFLLCTMGSQQWELARNLGLYLTCEPGVGYRGVFAKFRAYESSYLQNFIYGKHLGHLKDGADGDNYSVVIPNYFDPNDFEYSDIKDDYFLYIGRLISRKGIVAAHKVAQECGKKLVVAGQGMKFWDKKTQTLTGDGFTIQGGVEYVGYADKEKRNELMKNAKCTLVLTQYLEPFGGVSIESLFCGTPVITTNFGCFPETIPHGLVGYRGQTLDHFVWAANHIDNISPEKCREYAERNFSMDRVSEMFEEWFQMLYQVYLSRSGSVKGWHHIDPMRENLNWLNKYV